MPEPAGRLGIVRRVPLLKGANRAVRGLESPGVVEHRITDFSEADLRVVHAPVGDGFHAARVFPAGQQVWIAVPERFHSRPSLSCCWVCSSRSSDSFFKAAPIRKVDADTPLA